MSSRNARNSSRIKAMASFLNKGTRPVQEDFTLFDREKSIFVMADGFGGIVPGPEAARTACEAVKSFLFKEAGDLEATLPFILRTYFSLAGNVLFNSLIHANRKVTALNKDKNVNEKGGASVIAGFIDGDLIAIANVGICEAWLIREGRVADLVTPRSFARLRDPFSVEGAAELKIPLMTIGMSEDLEPEIVEYAIRDQDWIVFKSDGVPESVRNLLASIQSQGLHHDIAVKQVTEALGGLTYEDNAAISLAIL